MKNIFKKTTLLALISICIFSTANAIPRGGIGLGGQSVFTARISLGADIITVSEPDYVQCNNKVNYILMTNSSANLLSPCTGNL